MNALRNLKDAFRVLEFAPGLRGYSQYAKCFREPLCQREEQDEFLRGKEDYEVFAMKFKAAPNDVTCSRFFDPDVQLMARYLMKRGDKLCSRRLMDDAFANIKRAQLERYRSATDDADRAEIELSPLKIFKKAVENCTPAMGLKIVKRGGITYRVPTGLTPRRMKYESMKFLIAATMEKPKSERFTVAFAREVIDASELRGKAYAMKVDLHRQCEMNRAYAHYRWS